MEIKKAVVSSFRLIDSGSVSKVCSYHDEFLELILLMVQKSGKQPPGMYKPSK